MKLLHIDSSALGANSASRELSAAIVARWRADVPGMSVQYRDLDADPLPHLDGNRLAKADPARAEESERVLQQFLDADIVVIGAPIYNFSIPSTLKAWIDRLAVARRTFRYNEDGPARMAGDKRDVHASARVGLHAPAPRDFHKPTNSV